MRPARNDKSKNALQARRAAEAAIRHERASHLAAQPIVHYRAENPSRSGQREISAGSAFFRA
jgi:hypothetical protein